ncbi:MAG: hypothetical protein ACFE85_17780, partial [Candidatus Hodarchaeota archaeon]
MAIIKNFRVKIARIKLFFSDIKPILLSHHPNCENFSKHVYHIKSYRLCIGCFTFYPVLIMTAVFITIFLELSITTLLWLFYLSFLFFLPLILNILGLTK